MKFDYFYFNESEYFNYIQLPKELVRKNNNYSNLSADSKILYGLFLDRLSLSRKNGWVDDYGRIYVIYKRDSVMEDFDCSTTTATKLVRELISFGLIEQKRQQGGKPAIYYVKNFTKILDNNNNNYEIDKESEFSNEEYDEININSDVKKSLPLDVKKSLPLDVKKSLPHNNTNINNTNINNHQQQDINNINNTIDDVDDEISLNKIQEITEKKFNQMDCIAILDSIHGNSENWKEKLINYFEYVSKNKKITNKVGWIINAFYKNIDINNLHRKNYLSNSFNNFHQRDYDFEKVEVASLNQYFVENEFIKQKLQE